MCRWWLAIFLTLATPAVAEPIEPGDVYVIDGDTIVVGLNAPETSNVCEAERQLGLKAAQRWGR